MTLAVLVTLLAQTPDLDRAKEQYGQMKYDAALKSLAKAITAPGITRVDRAVIYLYTGLCRHQSGDEKGAQAAFREALAIDRALELPAGAGPKAVLTFERARAELPPVQPAAPPPPPAAPPLTPPPPVPAPEPVVTRPPPAPEEPPRVKRWWPFAVSLALGAASGGTGIFLGTRASSTFANAQAEPFGSEGQRLANTAYTYATAANVLYAVAGALALFAVIAAIAW